MSEPEHESSDRPVERTSARQPETAAAWPVRLVGQLLAATGVIALAEDLSLVELRGAVETWLGMYSDAVDRLRGFLFGWIDFWILDLDQGEGYLLAAVIILLAPVARANGRFLHAHNGDALAARAFGILLVGFYGVLVAAVLLVIPSWFSLAVIGAVMGVLFLALFFGPATESSLGGRAVRAELRPTLAAVVVILIINALLG